MTIGENIKETRKQANLTQKQLAEKLNVSQAMIAQYESGERNPKFETLAKIAAALDCDPFDLRLGEDVNKEINIAVTAHDGIIAILKDLYGNVEDKEVLGDFGSSNYYLVGTGNNKFILQNGTIDKLKDYIKSSIPFIIDSMKDTRSEDAVRKEILNELNGPEIKAAFERFANNE